MLVFHAGTRHDGDVLVTSGGRVLNVVGIADDQETARRLAYEGAHTVAFEGKQFRSDIAR